MNAATALRQNLNHGHAAHTEGVRHKRTVASPRRRFSTHNGDVFLVAHLNERFKRDLKRLGLHVIGVPAKASVAPARIGRIFAGAPQTAQRLHMYIFEMRHSQAASQGRAVELRIMARTGHPSDVDEAFDAIALKQGDEALDWQSRMADCEYSAFRPMRYSRAKMFTQGDESKRVGCRVNGPVTLPKTSRRRNPLA